ncbi:MAG: glycoside hydrolase family 5 protein [Brevinematia bacterium]
MAKKLLVFIFASLFLSCNLNQNVKSPSGSGDFISSTNINAFEMAKKLGKGVNMGNALEAYPDESSWGNPIKDEYFTLMKQAGFDTVRIPIRWSTRAQTTSPYTIDSNFFQRVDHVVDTALSAGLNVIINIHHYEEIISDPQGHKERFLALWRQISDHYKNKPDNLLFEVLNEPYGSLESYWKDFMTNAIKVIREKNPTRIVIIGGINWNSIDGLTNLYVPQNDPYIIATFHFYEPFVFTHQGAEWGGSISNVSNIVWPGPPATPVNIPAGLDSWISNWLVDYNTKQGAENPASSNQIISRLNTVSNWSANKNVPVWLGEFGVYGRYADINSRVRWTHFVRTECERRNISWCYWEFSAGFGIYNPSTGQWNSQLSNALVGE